MGGGFAPSLGKSPSPPFRLGRGNLRLPSGARQRRRRFKAEVVELADTWRSGRHGRKPVRVQLSPSAFRVCELTVADEDAGEDVSEEIIKVDGLEQAVHRPFAKGINDAFGILKRRHHHHRQLTINLLQLL